ncbi:MAG: DUF3343 domain-containing protein [Lachnospiraceae bacterium]|nr:DUF3343 domain-containing protein [Lachnospiraceae bacterium]
MFVVFFSTSNVFKAEEILDKAKIKCDVVPTPASDRAYCGVCLQVDSNEPLDVIAELEYVIMEG